MTTAPPELMAPMSEQYLARLLHQRIVVLDGELDDSIGEIEHAVRLMAGAKTTGEVRAAIASLRPAPKYPK